MKHNLQAEDENEIISKQTKLTIYTKAAHRKTKTRLRETLTLTHSQINKPQQQTITQYKDFNTTIYYTYDTGRPTDELYISMLQIIQ